MKKETILVVGASGTVGSELVKLLKADGYNVKTATSKVAQSPDQAHLNVATGEGIKAAMENVDMAFLLSPPGFADHYAVLSPLIQEAKRRGLKKVVLMTAMGANAVETSPFRKAEIELEKSGLDYNIIRPNWFMQNFNTFWVQGIREQNKIMVPAGNAKTSFIDTRDIAAVAAKLLTTDFHVNKDFDITGPEALDHSEVAQAIAQSTGRPVVYQDVASEDLKKGLLSAGLPADYVEFILMIFGFLREGYNSGINGNVKMLLGREPNIIRNYTEDYKQAWL